MDLVDADRRVEGLALASLRDPLLVVPGVARQVPDHRRGARPKLGSEPERIGLFDAVRRKARLDAVLVDGALAERRARSPPRCPRTAADAAGWRPGPSC